MNEIILLTGHNFMPEIHLRQPWSRYSVYGPLTKKQKIYTYHNELNKGCCYMGFNGL